jgi:acyl dehydratase
MSSSPGRKIRTFDELVIGEEAWSAALTVTEAHIITFAGLTGDFHPLHTNQIAAEQSPFGARIAHGLLVTSLSTGLINQAYFFEAIAILQFDQKMLAPVIAGDTIRVQSRLVEKRKTKAADRGIVVFERNTLNQSDKIVQQGRITFLAPVNAAGPTEEN